MSEERNKVRSPCPPSLRTGCTRSMDIQKDHHRHPSRTSYLNLSDLGEQVLTLEAITQSKPEKQRPDTRGSKEQARACGKWKAHICTIIQFSQKSSKRKTSLLWSRNSSQRTACSFVHVNTSATWPATCRCASTEPSRLLPMLSHHVTINTCGWGHIGGALTVAAAAVAIPPTVVVSVHRKGRQRWHIARAYHLTIERSTSMTSLDDQSYSPSDSETSSTGDGMPIASTYER